MSSAVGRFRSRASELGGSPEWVMVSAELVAESLGPVRLPQHEIAALTRSLSTPPRPAIRLRPGIDAASLPFEMDPVPWHSRGMLLAHGTRPGAALPFAVADYYIQEAASLLALALLNPQSGEMVCDLCASPGGKSTAILECLANGGWLLSNEAVESRVGMLEFNLARHGAIRYVGARLDPEPLAQQLPESFDAVLVDAPCSGQSLLARGKQSAASFAPRTIEHCAARQTRILDAAARLVRPGGRLVYSTCTFSFAENEQVVESFVQHQPDWSIETAPELETWQSECGPGHYRVWPHRHQCGGAYAARLRRRMDADPSMRVESCYRSSPMRSAAWPEPLSEWGELRESVALRRDFQTFGWPVGISDRLLRVALFGPEVGFRKGSTWFPSYSLAMRRDPNWKPLASMPLTDAQAIQYLQGHEVSGDVRGWAVATWNAKPLGWLKGDGTRMKNHLPKQARLVVK